MPNEIISNLWIGSISDNANDKIIKFNNIKLAINCTNNIDTNNLCKMHRIFIDPNTDYNASGIFNQKLFNLFDQTIDIIYNELNKNNGVLVFCHDGYQLSATIICMFLIKYGRLSLESAINSLVSKRPKIFSSLQNNIYIGELKMFEKIISNKMKHEFNYNFINN